MLKQVSLVAITFMQEYFADVAEISFSMNRVPAFIASYPKIMLQNHAITIISLCLIIYLKVPYHDFSAMHDGGSFRIWILPFSADVDWLSKRDFENLPPSDA